MKKILFTISLLTIGFLSYGQIMGSDNTKKIEVTGKAETEIIPDEIYLRITLKEYKNGSKTISMNTLEANLLKATKRLKLAEDALRVDNVYGYNWNWKKKKADEFLASKTFKLKVSDLKMVNELVDDIDSEGLNNLSIAEVSHSKLEELKMDLKIEALKNAKQKAASLLLAIDEKIGSTLEVQEIEYGNNNQVYARSNMMLAEADNNYQSNLEFKNITIKAQIRAVFEIE